MREPSPNFTPQAQDLIFQSKILAISLGSSYVGPDHLLISILQSAPSKIISFMSNFNINIKDYVEFIIAFASLSNSKSPIAGSPSFSEDYKSCLSDSAKFSDKLNHGYIGPEHLFFSVINLQDGSTDTYLTTIGMSTKSFIQSYVSFLKHQDELLGDFTDYPTNEDIFNNPSDPNSFKGPPSLPQEGSSLESFCIDITALCKEGKIDPVIGRSEETERIIEILSRKNKNNPLLLGEPGVGKTACIEGLAQIISGPNCPPFLINKKVFSVDLASMIAGTKYRGQFEQRLKSLIKECSSDRDIFLFIDEIHT
jgi:ATP-dependent Clp protease ATP-binding subunit ClpC